MNVLQNQNTTKDKIAHCFNQAANSYDNHAVLQQEIGDRCLERLEYIKINPQTILDLGAATGFLTQKIQQRYANASIVGIDLATALLSTAKQQTSSSIAYLGADMEQLPFIKNSFDFIFSNLSLQWCQDPKVTFKEVFRLLKPNGLFLFTTVGPDTLYELKESWRTIDPHYHHANQFLDMHHVGDGLLKTKFQDPVIDKEYFTLTYSHPKTLLKDLKATGTHAVLESTRNTLSGKNKLQAMYKAYEQFKNEDGLYPATYEIIYGHAWKPVENANKEKTSPNEWHVPVESIKKLERS